MQVVKALWDSWADDAVLDDRAAGATPTPTASGRSTTRASTTRSPGRSTCRAAPQGRPVLVQAGSSETGRRFAARHAEAVFTAQMEKATAQEFYADLKALVAARGPARRPGADPARPQPDDRRRPRPRRSASARELNDLSDPGGRAAAAVRPVRRPRLLAPAARPAAVAGGFPRSRRRCEAARSRTEVIVGLVRREKPTLRQLLG